MKGFRLVIFWTTVTVAQFWLPEIHGQLEIVGQSSIFDRLRRQVQNIVYGRPPKVLGPYGYGPKYSMKPKLPSKEGEGQSSEGHDHLHHAESKGSPHHYHSEPKGPSHHHHHAGHEGPPHGWGWPVSTKAPNHGWGWPGPTKAPHHGWGWQKSTKAPHHGWGWQKSTKAPHHGWGWPGPTKAPHHGWGWPGPTKAPHHGWGWPGPTKAPHHGWGWPGPTKAPNHGWGWPASTKAPHHGWGWPVSTKAGWGWPAHPPPPPPHHGWGWNGKPLSSFYNSPFFQHPPNGHSFQSSPFYPPTHPDSDSDSHDLSMDHHNPNNPKGPVPPNGPDPTPDPDSTRDNPDTTPDPDNPNVTPDVPPTGPVDRPCPLCSCAKVPTRRITSLSDIPPGWNVILAGQNRTFPLTSLDFTLPSIPRGPLQLDRLTQPLPRDYTISWTESSLIEMSPARSNTKNRVRIAGRPFQIQREIQGSITRSGSLLNQNPKLIPNSIEILNAVILSKNNSAPLAGYKGGNNTLFTSALNTRNAILIDREMNNPLETQLRDLSQIFQELDTLERKPRPRRSNKTSQKTNIGSIFATTTHRYTYPEPDSSEGLILDAYYNFGNPGRIPIEFGGVDLIKDLWEVNLNESQPLDPTMFGKTEEEISRDFRQNVRSLVKSIRDAGKPGFIQAEDIAFHSFKQFQYFIIPPAQDNLCEEEVDPAKNPDVIAANAIAGSGPMPESNFRGPDD